MANMIHDWRPKFLQCLHLQYFITINQIKAPKWTDRNSRIIQILKSFSEANCAPEQEKEQADKVEPVSRRDPQHKLEIESVKFGHQKLQGQEKKKLRNKSGKSYKLSLSPLT